MRPNQVAILGSDRISVHIGISVETLRMDTNHISALLNSPAAHGDHRRSHRHS